MQKRSTAPARAFAAIALITAFLVLIVVITTSLGGGGSPGSGGHAPAGKAQVKGVGKKVATKSSYVIQSGDTLTAIAHKTGVSVARIQQLNPGVDPRILISGEKLKLR